MQDGGPCRPARRIILGTGFAEAAASAIRMRKARSNSRIRQAGVLRRGMIGGVIMVHGDDDGLRCPPMIAPYQAVIVPMLRDTDEDAAVLDYCEALARISPRSTSSASRCARCSTASRSRPRTSAGHGSRRARRSSSRSAGVTLRAGNAPVLRRDKLHNDAGKTASSRQCRATPSVAEAVGTLRDIQASLYEEGPRSASTTISATAPGTSPISPRLSKATSPAGCWSNGPSLAVRHSKRWSSGSRARS